VDPDGNTRLGVVGLLTPLVEAAIDGRPVSLSYLLREGSWRAL
jgi:hypothetical protein